MPAKPFCDVQGRVVVSANCVSLQAWLAQINGVHMAEHSQGNIPTAPLKIDGANWRLIEEAYGASLPPNVRAHIVQATEMFLFSESFERTDEPLAKVKVILEAHDKAATRFFNELFGGAASFSDAGVYAHYLIDSNFKPARLGSEKADLDAFLDFLRAFHIACNTAIKQLNDSSTDRKGMPWKVWLNRLAEIVEVKLLRGEGSSESNIDHLFVLFVRELQKSLPTECQRDQAAIAEGVLEARSKLRKAPRDKG